MPTDQSTPPPRSSPLAGSAGIAEPAGTAEPAAIAGPVAMVEQVGTVEPAGIAGPVAMVEQTDVAEPGESIKTASSAETANSATHPTDVDPISGHADLRSAAGSSRQAEASGHLVAMSFPGARRVAGWLFWVVFPLLCIGAIHTSVTNVVHHLGNKPVGIRGTFVVQPRSCSQGFCSFGGLFTSDDHTIRNLPLLGDPRWHTAEVHRVTYDPRSVEATALPGHWDPTPSVMAAFGALTYLVVIGYFFREQRRSVRTARARQPATVS